MSNLAQLLDETGLAPHGMGLLWRPELIWLHALSDTIIAIACCSIPLALAYVARRRTDLALGWLFWLFAFFALACGATHVMGVWTLWQPVYAAEGIVKAITAIAAVATAFLLWPLMPRLLATPSATALAQVNLAEMNAERAAALAALEQETAKRKRTEAALMQAQKLESLGHLIGGVTHDFNNLMQVIAANLELLQADFTGSADSRDRIDMALAASERGVRLTRQLLVFARRQPLEPMVLDLSQQIAAMSDMLTRTLGSEIQVLMPRGAGVWMTLADPSEVENTVLNLAINARDAMPYGGRLIVELANTVLGAAYAAQRPDVTPGDYVMLAMTGTGTGLNAETQAAAEGSGLGLSQVYGFAKRAGGHVAIDSRSGQGTTVRLYLPRTDDVPRPQLADSGIVPLGHGHPTDDIPVSSVRVLVVEDDPLVGDATAEMLTELGYDGVVVSDAAAALAALEQQSFDMVMTDIGLPGMSGTELAAEIRRRWPTTAVLIVSGMGTAVTSSDPLMGYMPKPFSVSTLRTALAQLLG